MKQHRKTKKHHKTPKVKKTTLTSYEALHLKLRQVELKINA